jgi:Tol biopolymer transport system component
LTFEGNANLPVWTPDGKRVVYRLTKPEADGLFWKPADGSGPEESLFTTAEFGPQTSSVSPDGQTVAFYANSPATGTDLWVFPLQGQGERKPRPFLQTPFTEAAPRFSPDGRWLVYSSNESGRSEIYVQPYPGPGGKWLISTEGGNQAVWARNGRALFFRSGDKMMAVDIQTQPAFQAGTPRMLFERAGYLGGQAAPDYDVSPDGQRFLMMKEGQQPEAAQRFSTGAGTLATTVQVHVVLNWFEELKQRAPAGKQ